MTSGFLLKVIFRYINPYVTGRQTHFQRKIIRIFVIPAFSALPARTNCPELCLGDELILPTHTTRFLFSVILRESVRNISFFVSIRREGITIIISQDVADLNLCLPWRLEYSTFRFSFLQQKRRINADPGIASPCRCFILWHPMFSSP